MTAPKAKITAALFFISTAIAAVIGYGIMIPKYGSWGIAYTVACALLAIFCVYLFFLKKDA